MLVKQSVFIFSITVFNTRKLLVILFMFIFFLELNTMSKVEKTFFQESWLSNEEFKSWLVPTENKSQARCKRCKKTFEL